MTPDRTATGRFQPGHGQPGPGRPSKRREEEILEAVARALPPDQIEVKLRRAMEIAEQQGSARAMVACLEFAASYLLGKPRQIIESKPTNFDALLARLQMPVTIAAGDDEAEQPSDNAA